MVGAAAVLSLPLLEVPHSIENETANCKSGGLTY